MRIASLLVLSAVAAWTQTAETIPFRAILSPQNEVPAVNINASGAATVWLHVVRDAQGRVTSATTDFDVNYRFPSQVTFTGMHIHRGRAGENGPVTIDSGLRAADAIRSDESQKLRGQGYTASENAAGMETVNGLLNDPSGFYVNVHTTDNPGGVIRGQLQRADAVVLLGQMSPLNEVPAITDLPARGLGSIVALMTRDASGVATSGQVIFEVNYQGFPENTAFTGLHIHTGRRGMNGPVTIDSGITAANAVMSATGSGNLRYEVEVPLTNPNAVETLYGLFNRPDQFYVNLHTRVFPGGAIRAQLQPTDLVNFQVNLSPSQEVPPVSSTASAPSSFTAYTVRNARGAVEGAVVVFDVNYRGTGAATFTGLHIHNGPAGQNGPVTIDSGLTARTPVETASGNGNIFRMVTVNSATALQALNSVVATPELHYLNLHTATNPAGLMRAQLAAADTTLPNVNAVISAVSDPSLRRVAPGGLATIFGSNLMRVMSDPVPTFMGEVATTHNGTTVRIGELDAPIVQAGPGFLVVQVPFEVPVGMRRLTVQTPAGISAATEIEVAPASPALFFDSEAGIFTDLFFRLTGRMASPAARGQFVIAYATGLPLQGGAGITGRLPVSILQSAAVTAMIDGRRAEVLNAVQSPGYLGLYQVYIRVPMDARTGPLPLTIRVGDVESNRVMLYVQ